jgi:radical SAM protein with 4Fe4S-binding SPASM domain
MPPLSAQEWRFVLDRVAPTAAQLKITGGEPTLHPGFEEIVEHVDASGVPFVLFTNGRWAKPERLLDFLAGLSHLDGLLISLHGARPASHEAFTGVAGSYAETVGNVERAVEAGLRVTTSTVLTRQSCSEVEEVIALGKELGVDGAAFQRYIGAPALEAGWDELRRAIDAIEGVMNGNGRRVRFGTPIPHCFVPNHSVGCCAGVAQATIDPWGNLRPCNHVSLACGNLLRQPLDEVWASVEMRRFRDAIPEQCRSCEAFGTCRSGCRAAILERGLDRDPLMKNPILL